MGELIFLLISGFIIFGIPIIIGILIIRYLIRFTLKEKSKYNKNN